MGNRKGRGTNARFDTPLGDLGVRHSRVGPFSTYSDDFLARIGEEWEVEGGKVGRAFRLQISEAVSLASYSSPIRRMQSYLAKLTPKLMPSFLLSRGFICKPIFSPLPMVILSQRYSQGGITRRRFS